MWRRRNGEHASAPVGAGTQHRARADHYPDACAHALSNASPYSDTCADSRSHTFTHASSAPGSGAYSHASPGSSPNATRNELRDP
jgi:hypothetical protein